MRKNLLLIDGHNFLFRSWGIPFKFESENGMPLHVATAFLSALRRTVSVLDEYQGCTHLIVVFDSQGKTSNHELYDGYKANRPDFSEDENSPFLHLPIIKKILEHLSVQMYEIPGVEADDIIGTLATRFIETNKRQHHAFIASTDSDFYQLLRSNIRQVVMERGGGARVIDPAWVRRNLGVSPKQYVFFKSLVGDPSDNIPGVPGVGPVRASRIVNRTLKIPLEPHREILDRNHTLITLNCNAAIKPAWEHVKLKPQLLTARNQEIFATCGF